MSRVARFVLTPSVAPLAIFGLWLTPVALIGCTNRGLAAFSIAVLAGLAGIATGVIGILRRRGGDPDSAWWLLATLILALSALLLLGPLG
jgi:hypothetical protein